MNSLWHLIFTPLLFCPSVGICTAFHAARISRLELYSFCWFIHHRFTASHPHDDNSAWVSQCCPVSIPAFRNTHCHIRVHSCDHCTQQPFITATILPLLLLSLIVFLLTCKMPAAQSQLWSAAILHYSMYDTRTYARTHTRRTHECTHTHQKPMYTTSRQRSNLLLKMAKKKGKD